MGLAASLFARIASATSADRGITRASYGRGEQIAHDIVRETAQSLTLEICTDPAGNLYCTLPGQQRGFPVIVGSHLDSVPEGGDFDGTAGVLMALAVIAGLRASETVPPLDITAIAIRAEESVWFDASFIGSRGAFGQIDPADLALRRSDSGMTLEEHMAALGCDIAAVRQHEAYLRPASIAAFIEPHIEQGPILISKSVPVGIVTDIRGSRRFRRARCVGQDAHSGAAPMDLRADAVLATSELVLATDAAARKITGDGRDAVATVGIFTTDSTRHAFSKVAGLVSFAIDLRSNDAAILDEMQTVVEVAAARIGIDRNVSFDLGPATGSIPVRANPHLVAGLAKAASDCGIPTITMPSGAGHDTSVFARNGVPASMIFIRNSFGSHNPDEAMEMEDFAAAAQVLMSVCLDPAEHGVRAPKTEGQ